MIFISVLLGLMDFSDTVMSRSWPNSCCQQNLKCFDMPLLSLRSAISGNIFLPRYDLSFTQKSIAFSGAKLWNEIPVNSNIYIGKFSPEGDGGSGRRPLPPDHLTFW